MAGTSMCVSSESQTQRDCHKLHLLEPYLNLTTECRRGFRSCSLKMSKLLFLLELVASSQVNPQVAYCSISCIFSRRLLLNVNMMAQPVKNLPAMLEIWVWSLIPGEGNGNTLQYSCLENSMDRGVWWATVSEDCKQSDTAEERTLSLSCYFLRAPP